MTVDLCLPKAHPENQQQSTLLIFTLSPCHSLSFNLSLSLTHALSVPPSHSLANLLSPLHYRAPFLPFLHSHAHFLPPLHSLAHFLPQLHSVVPFSITSSFLDKPSHSLAPLSCFLSVSISVSPAHSRNPKTYLTQDYTTKTMHFHIMPFSYS